MNWWSLYVKELRLTKHKFLINIGGLLIVAIILLVLVERYNSLFLILTIPLIIVHVFYMFFAMLDSLRQEWKQKTSIFWLNIPSSGWKLLTAKFVATMTQLLISLSATFVISYLFLQRSTSSVQDPTIPKFIVEQFQSYWWIVFVGILITAMQLGAVSTFIYMVAKSVQKWGWLLGIIIVAAASWLWSIFQGTAIYKGITQWGVILNEETIMNSFESISGDPIVDMEIANDAVLYLGTPVVTLLEVVIILFACAWLLDHKVEA